MNLDALAQVTIAITKSILVEPPVSERDEIRRRVADFKAHQNASYGNERTSRRPC
jgi:hypothetical protein